MSDVFLLDAGGDPADVTLGEAVTHVTQAPAATFVLPSFRRPQPQLPPPRRMPATYSLSFGVFVFAKPTLAADTHHAPVPVDWDAELEDLFILGLWEVPA